MLHDVLFFFFNDTATTEIYTLSLHDALPISPSHGVRAAVRVARPARGVAGVSGYVARAGARGAGVHLRTLRGARVQPHRRPRARREEPPDSGARAAGGAALAGAGVERRGDRGGGVSRDRVGAEPPVPRARARRARIHLGVQLREAVHALVAPVARTGGRDRNAGGLPRRDGPLERSLGDARRRRGGRDLLGGRGRRGPRAPG